MKEEHDHLWNRLRAYLRILAGSQDRADRILMAFLRHLLGHQRPPEDFIEALSALHAWLPDQFWLPVKNDDAPELQRVIGWYLSGFTFRERALIVLSSMPDVGLPAARRILGLQDEEAAAILHDVGRRGGDTSVIVLSAQAFVALDVAMIVQDLGIRRVRVTPHLTGLCAMAARERPLAVIADTEGGIAPETVASVLHRSNGRDIPSVILDARGRSVRGGVSLRKPFTARALRQAFLTAIGA